MRKGSERLMVIMMMMVGMIICEWVRHDSTGAGVGEEAEIGIGATGEE
jgi:hypothetical protein